MLWCYVVGRGRCEASGLHYFALPNLALLCFALLGSGPELPNLPGCGLTGLERSWALDRYRGRC